MIYFFYTERDQSELFFFACYPCCILSSLKTLVYEQMVLDPTMPVGLTLSIDDGGKEEGKNKKKG